jgi:hypothetical protein
VPNPHPHSITGYAVHIQPKQDVARVTNVVSQSDDEHRDAGKVRNLAHEFNAQREQCAGRVLSVGSERAGAFARQEFESHCEDADARSGV